ncbi:ROK family transcriptional regulator [Spirochaeta isovalerica]|uniref:Putative NBD/HSP70 family sugar kinase n=1 Tax=Spirochaeta isovalerica TaxID=150 RepID=A0A841R8J1_9SPIO|nr:ROK family transcriptional regulator [Spirochaeta isovalerica]MBB6481604.1 putative NBD/HSP70 family sugar kinase [Spirochaeta isovalerica]
MKINNSKVRSQYNLLRVLRAIWLNHGISRIELCRKFDMDKATMSSVTAHLIELNLVEEVEPQNLKIKPGRKPIGLGVQGDFGFVAGIEFHIYGIRAVLKDMHSRTVFSSDFPFDVRHSNIKEEFLNVYGILRKELGEKRLLGIGVAIPGVVNHEEAIILKSAKMGIEEEPYCFGEEVFSELDVPCFIDNDANCCARGILADHREEGYSNFLYCHINYYENRKIEDNNESLGIGFGIVINEKLYYGPEFTAGEFQTIEYNPERVNQLNLTSRELDLYGKDAELQKRVFYHLASHIAMFVNVFNFKHLFLGGDLPSHISDLEGLFREVIDKNWLYKNQRDCGIHLMSRDEMSPALGAAGMFLDQLFTVPELEHSRGALIWQGIFGDGLVDY